MRRHVPILLLAVLSAGCASQSGTPQAQAPEGVQASPSGAPGTTPGAPSMSPGQVRLAGEGTFEPFTEGAAAVVYDEKLVPKGAKAEVSVRTKGDETISEVDVEGLRPDRKYGAHLHVNACGRNPEDSGPHFRESDAGATATPGATGMESPAESPAETPAESPAETPSEPGASPSESGAGGHQHPANPKNEIWLDFTTNGKGNAEAKARQPWALMSDRVPGSLVIHAEPTKTEGPKAGDAGDRVACVTLKPATG